MPSRRIFLDDRWLRGPYSVHQNTTDVPSAGDFQADSRSGRNLHFGIREHSMGAILNGLALSKLRPFGSGFLIFSDYGEARSGSAR